MTAVFFALPVAVATAGEVSYFPASPEWGGPDGISYREDVASLGELALGGTRSELPAGEPNDLVATREGGGAVNFRERLVPIRPNPLTPDGLRYCTFGLRTARCETTTQNIGGIFISLGFGADRASVGGGEFTLVGGRGDDSLTGGGFGDFIFGGGGADALRGRGDSDQITGDSNRDLLAGGDGNDVLSASGDGSRDTVRCGDGVSDVAYVDAIDLVFGCEDVQIK